MLDDRMSLGVSLRNPITNGSDEEREYTAYANGRIGLRPQLTVTFRQVDGSSHSFAYSHLYSVAADSEAGGFIVEFSQHKVTIQGRNLAQLFRYICDHKVHTIQGTSPSQMLALTDEQPVVTLIRVLTISPALDEK